MSSHPVLHHVRFEADGRLFAEHWLTLTHDELPPGFILDSALAERMGCDYFDMVRRINLGVYRIRFAEGGDVWVRTPWGSSLLIFQHQSIATTEWQAEVSWQITSGFMLAHGARDGHPAQFSVGAEWSPNGDDLRLYAKLENYTTRLVDLFGPRLGRWIYNLSQGISHSYIITRYLRAEAKRIKDNSRRALAK